MSSNETEARDTNQSKARLLPALLVASLLANFALIYMIGSREQPTNNRPLIEEITKSPRTSNFTLVSPHIAYMTREEFLDKQKNYIPSYTGLKLIMNETVKNKSKERDFKYGIYFEDLNTGAWVGINERDKFVPASLMKIPVVVGILKKVEDGGLTLDTKVTVHKEDVDNNYGELGGRGFEQNYTLFELINYTLYYSDNTALLSLRDSIDDADVIDAMIVLGITYKTQVEYPNSKDGLVFISPKDYSNIFRTLYYSGYLRRQHSQLMLELLASTSFKNGLPAGVPKNVTVSHKIGSFTREGKPYYHDCGIIYAPDKPYILCIMTSDLSLEESNQLMEKISKDAYDYVSGNNQNQ